MTNHHPLTDQIISEELITGDECLRREGDGRAMYYEEDFRVGADWQLEQVLRWFQFDYGTDPNLSRERKMRGGFKEISTALEKAMRPTQEDN